MSGRACVHGIGLGLACRLCEEAVEAQEMTVIRADAQSASGFREAAEHRLRESAAALSRARKAMQSAAVNLELAAIAHAQIMAQVAAAGHADLGGQGAA